MSDDAIAIELTYPHPPTLVWRALTDSDALAAWLMPNDFAPELGRRFSFRDVNAHGWSGTVDCEVVAIEPPRRLAFTWHGVGTPLHTLVEFRLDPVAEGTRLRLTHSGFASGGPAGLSIRDILAGGWDSKLLRENLPALLDRLAVEAV